jgi:hypothetical protein
MLWIAFAAATGLTTQRYLDLRASVRWIAREFKDAAPWSLAQTTERTQSQLRSRYDLPPNIVAAVASRRVHVDPWETAVVDGYPEIDWRPLPVFQSYSAYTPYLDELNASRLASAEAPDRILRHLSRYVSPPRWLVPQRGKPLAPGEQVIRVVDGRFRWFESPAAMLQTFCRYREVTASATWQVLERTGRTCATAEPIASLVVREGETVNVPKESRPDRFVVVRVHGLERTPLDQVRAALYKAREWYVTLSDGVRYRLVAATAADGLILAVPAAADGTAAFAFGTPISTMAIQSGLTGPGSGRSLTYEFLSVPLEP